jgi:hypothetical protein
MVIALLPPPSLNALSHNLCPDLAHSGLTNPFPQRASSSCEVGRVKSETSSEHVQEEGANKGSESEQQNGFEETRATR